MQATAQLAALADPTRRSIFELMRRGPASVRELTDQVSISQPAVSQHLKVLREAALVDCKPHGASNIYTIDRRGLNELRLFIDSLWDEALDAFVAVANDPEEQIR